jgi:hypothetical protein
MNTARALEVDNLYESTINQSWRSSLCFPKGWLLLKDTPFESLDITPTFDADLFGLTNVAMAGYIFRFDPSDYPVTDTFKGKGFKKLMAQLNANAKGYKLANNGGFNSSRFLRCEQYFKPVTNANPTICDENMAPKEYRKTSNSNDRKNNRANGHKAQPRRRYTTKTDMRCLASLTISHDEHSFYLKCGVGCAEHHGHIQLADAEVRDSIRSLNDGMLVNVAAMAVASAQPTTAAAIVKAQTGLNITRKQVAYLLGMNRLAEKLNSDVIHRAINGLSVAQKEEERWSANDNMLEYLEHVGASHCCLYHSGASSELRKNQKSTYCMKCMN